MNQDSRNKVVEGVARGEYSFLLGAGASAGAIGGNGRPLPTGPELRNTLLQEFQIDTAGQSVTLSSAYSTAQRKDSNRLQVLINSWFINCTPDWQVSLTAFDWHRIWTLNIDDVVETAFQSKSMPYKRFDWTSTFRDATPVHNQIIHLHGYAIEQANEEERPGLVFSIKDYAAAVSAPIRLLKNVDVHGGG